MTPPRPRFVPRLHDNVNAMWKRRKWYLAHIISIDVGGVCKYSVYFPGDGKVKRGLSLDEIRPVDPSANLTRRTELIGKTFYFDGDHELGPGLWKVRRMTDTTYVCLLQSECAPSQKNQDEFDIGYVMRRVKAEAEERRQH